MLTINNLYVSVEGKEILNGVDLTVRPGEVHAIMGPNGSGKSTLAYALMGHPKYKLKVKPIRPIRQAQGKQAQGGSAKCKVELDGKSLIGRSPDERARMGLFMAFQYPVAIEGVSVQNFLRKASESLDPTSHKATRGRGPTSPEASKGRGGRSKVSVLAFRKGLVEKAQSLGVKEELLRRSLNDGFSGGEMKRVEILQMETLKPKYAVLDETDSGLDIDALGIVADGINRVTRSNRRMGVVLITHYQRILRFIKPDFVHVMIDGKIVKSGSTELAKELEKKGYTQLVTS